MPLSIKKNSGKRQFLCYCIFAAYLFIMHMQFLPGDCDDGWFASALNCCDIWEYLGRRYAGWTSRLIPEVLIVCLTRCNPWIWKILDILFLLLLIYASVCVFVKKQHYLYTGVFMLLFLLIPPNMLHSSGWITQSVNYTWTIAAGVYAIVPLRRLGEWGYLGSQQKTVRQAGGKVRVWEWAAFPAACFFACFQEQVAAVLLASYLLWIGYSLYRKTKVPVLWYFMLGIICMMFFFIMTCPGNALRSIAETETWFPQHKLLSVWQKLLIGCLQAFSFYLSSEGYNMIFLMFSGGLFLAVCALHKCIWKRLTAAVPFGITLFWGLAGRMIADSDVTSHTYWMKLLQNNKLPDFGVYGRSHVLIECVIFFVVFGAVLYSLYLIFNKTGWFVTAVLVLCASLCTRIIIGFSPTVYASLSRMALIGCVGFSILTFLCIQETVEKLVPKKYLTYMSILYLCALIVTMHVGNLTETY